VRADERAAEAGAASYEERAEIAHRKWRILHKYLRDNPFEVSAALARTEQWRRVRDHIKRTVDEPEIVDWLIVQVEVATNRAKGVQDLRPRKDGPCHPLLMEFVRDRKRKAVAVLRWSRGQGGPKRPSFEASRPPILPERR
jgi:hypothetical protein